MTRREKSVRAFLTWLRDNPHHFAGIVEEPKTLVRTGFFVAGHGTRKQVAQSTFKAACKYFEPATGSTDRMYRPSDLGMQLLNGEVQYEEDKE